MTTSNSHLLDLLRDCQDANRPEELRRIIETLILVLLQRDAERTAK